MQPRKTPTKRLFVHKGASMPLLLRRRSTDDDSLVPYETTLVCRITIPNESPITLSVGNGITLSTEESVENGLATLTLTRAQSRLIPAGNFASYELQQGEGDNEKVILQGDLVGIGGNNPDD